MGPHAVKHLLLLLPLIAFTSVIAAEERGELIFEDHFERSESQETKDESRQWLGHRRQEPCGRTISRWI